MGMIGIRDIKNQKVLADSNQKHKNLKRNWRKMFSSLEILSIADRADQVPDSKFRIAKNVRNRWISSVKI